MSGMAGQGLDPDDVRARYDDIAEGYLVHWAPVIRHDGEGILDAVAPALDAGARRLVDIGTGSGTLAIAALRRWPGLRATGVDPSSEMLAMAGREAASRLGSAGAARFDVVQAPADRLPFPEGAFDVAVSSFVLQLVPDRSAALTEARRVLSPGGTLGWITWLRGERRFAGDEVADDVLEEFGFEPPEPDGRSGDPASVAAAAAATRRAGFRQVRAWAGELAHRWTPEAFLAFLTRFDQASSFDELAPDERRRLEARLLERLGALSQDELTYRLPTVSVMGRVPEG
jgi:ubiquinone/menaquinone biosynthesis C-methylase UbiE